MASEFVGGSYKDVLSDGWATVSGEFEMKWKIAFAA
jgi:hypothetical protein